VNASMYRNCADGLLKYWDTMKRSWNDERSDRFISFTIKPIVDALNELADEEDAFNEECRTAEESARSYYDE